MFVKCVVGLSLGQGALAASIQGGKKMKFPKIKIPKFIVDSLLQALEQGVIDIVKQLLEKGKSESPSNP